METRTAVIFASGELDSLPTAASVAHPGDYWIAADGGLRHALALGRLPDVLIGDLDSVTPEQLAQAEAAGVRILRYPVEKDDTDLELALLQPARWPLSRIAALLAETVETFVGEMKAGERGPARIRPARGRRRSRRSGA